MNKEAYGNITFLSRLMCVAKDVLASKEYFILIV